MAKFTSKNKSSAKKETAKAPVVRANATSFKLEEGIDVPPSIRTRGGSVSYPFASMEEGVSFFVAAQVDADLYATPEEAAVAQAEECRKVAARMSGAVRRFTKVNEGTKFAVRTVEDLNHGHGVRVWRVAAK